MNVRLKDEGVFFSQNTESKENECGKHIQKKKKRNEYEELIYTKKVTKDLHGWKQ